MQQRKSISSQQQSPKGKTVNNNQVEKLTPAVAVRDYCTQCLGLKQFNTEQIKDCQGDQAANGPCPFYPYRLGHRRISVKIFRCFCMDCTGADRAYIEDCPASTCPCYLYRFGSNPALVGKRKAPQEGVEALRKHRERRRHDLKNDLKPVFLP